MPFSRVRRLDFVHPIDLFLLALRLGRFGVFRAKPIDENLQPFDLSLLIFIGGQKLFLTCRLLGDIFVVIAAVRNQFALINLDDSSRRARSEMSGRARSGESPRNRC